MSTNKPSCHSQQVFIHFKTPEHLAANHC